jgi:hypothetical protein
MLAMGISIILSSVAYSAIYYIDYNSGSDTNNGTSTSTPWKYAPGMSGWSGKASLANGDKIVLKGGATWKFTSTKADLWIIPISGITIQGGQRLNTPWGTGYPVLDATGTTSNQRVGFYINGKSNITIDGIKMSNTEYSPSGGSGIFFRGVIRNLEVKSCYLDHTGDQSFRGSPSKGSSHILIHDNITSNVGRLFIAVEDSGNVDDIQIYNNTFLGVGSWPGGIVGGVHGDGIMIGSACTADNTCLTNLSIHHNKFYGDWASGATALIFLQNGRGSGSKQYGGNHVEIYDNQLAIDTDGVISPGYLGIWSLWNDVKIYNNTFGGYHTGSHPVSSCIFIAHASTAIDIKNNIFSGCTNSAITNGAPANYAEITADYNYYSSEAVRLLNGWVTNQDCRTIEDCQAYPFSQEAHGLRGDPKFVSRPNGTVGSGNWHLQSSSPATGIGQGGNTIP